MKKLSIIIPVYNEEGYICKVLERVINAVLSEEVDRELILVDDGSEDKTASLIETYIKEHSEYDIKFFKHPENYGKGAAVSKGIKEATGDYIVIQDADLEYDPDELGSLLDLVHKGYADVVYGSRFRGSNPHRVLFFWHYMGNKFLTWLSNLFANLNLTDMETCYKMFRAEIVKPLILCEKRFGFEPEITAKMAKVPDIRVYEVGISYYGRTYKEGKKINWKDGVHAILCVLKYNLFPR
ncbi:MAG: glycosyltransferase family 2 protein [Candidatus Omnitrophota bacterium]